MGTQENEVWENEVWENVEYVTYLLTRKLTEYRGEVVGIATETRLDLILD